MELAWPRLANEEIAIAIVVDNTRKKVATTNAIDRERCMTRPPEEANRTVQFRGPQGLFNGLRHPHAVYG
jgi:hypothetical protein